MRDLEVEIGRQGLDGIDVAEVFVVHQEADDIAPGMAAEAVEELLGFTDSE